MAFDFPNFPTDGMVITGPGGTRFEWTQAGNRWRVPQPAQFVTQQELEDALRGDTVVTGPTAPASPNPGDLWFDTVNNVLNVWDGSNWVPSTQPLTGFLPLTGGVLTGNLYLSGAGVLANYLMATGVGNAFVGSYAQAGANVNMGFWTSTSGNMYFGYADGFGNPQPGSQFADFDSVGNLTLSVGSVSATNGFVRGQTGCFAGPDTSFGFASPAPGFMRFSYNAVCFWQFVAADSSAGYYLGAGLFWHMRTSDWLCYNNIGAVGGQTAYVTLSDARGKSDVAPTEHGLDAVMQLDPVQFRRAPEKAIELGFVAQDVQRVLPEAVVAMGIELPDGSGGIDSEAPTLGVREAALIPVLVNAIKELAAKVEDLQRRL